ncbi:glycosyltransferase family 4 protein [Candidatus Saccharibacteria bacterium]|nr:MAG: glycosyltransferase family 4 protein [Candidatus Saccharibacteria bacterium]
MISFVWPPGEPMLGGTGGSETYTAGHVRELLRRGIDAQVVTIGHGIKDGRQDFRDVPFVSFADEKSIGQLVGTVVFVNKAYHVPTQRKSAIILHCSIPKVTDRQRYQSYIVDKTVIATSVYSAQQWALYLDIPYARINVVLPFADPKYGAVIRHKPSKYTRIVYAGRLHPEKGIYTILEMMHQQDMQNHEYRLAIVTAGQHVAVGREIARMLQGHPFARLIPAKKSVNEMAELLAHVDVLLMPSVFAEPFGMLSIEAQHAGCRVVASNVGGLPETNCGLLTLVEPRSPLALMTGIKQARALGSATRRERDQARREFRLDDSVDGLLMALKHN